MDSNHTQTAAAGTCRIKKFLEKTRTPAAKCLIIGAAILAGTAAGMLLSSVSGGIHIEVSVGSHNGCSNVTEA